MGAGFKKNPGDYEDTGKLTLKEASENSADHLISILSEIKKDN